MVAAAERHGRSGCRVGHLLRHDALGARLHTEANGTELCRTTREELPALAEQVAVLVTGAVTVFAGWGRSRGFALRINGTDAPRRLDVGISGWPPGVPRAPARWTGPRAVRPRRAARARCPQAVLCECAVAHRCEDSAQPGSALWVQSANRHCAANGARSAKAASSPSSACHAPPRIPGVSINQRSREREHLTGSGRVSTPLVAFLGPRRSVGPADLRATKCVGERGLAGAGGAEGDLRPCRSVGMAWSSWFRCRRAGRRHANDRHTGQLRGEVALG